MKKGLIFLLVVSFAYLGHAQKGKNEALEALGGSCGLLLYNSFLIVGMAADGYTSESYTSEKAAQLVGEQLGGIETIETQYNALLKSGFLTDPSDISYFKEIVDAFDLVRKEGEALVEYIKSGSDGDAAKYARFREAAWEEISRLLGME